MDVEATRELIGRGYPVALTVDPEDLAALRRHDRLAWVRLVVAVVVLGLAPVALLSLTYLVAVMALVFASWP